jgi:chromosomal replication initiator protein
METKVQWCESSMLNAVTSASEIWRAVLGRIEINMDRRNYQTWFSGSKGVQVTESSFVMSLPSPFTIAWLERKKYSDIQNALHEVTGKWLDIQMIVSADTHVDSDIRKTATMQTVTSLSGSDHKTSDTVLKAPTEFAPNAKYAFESFITGPSNIMAYSAAIAVGEAPGRNYNPLFIYSGVGLGKTHLMYSLGKLCTEQGLSVRYASSEQFTNEFINAIRNRSTDEFRDRYRTVDVLLIEDIQFMTGKEQTQEGFFHTFNELHNSGKQIVLTADKAPGEMGLLEERLLSRFSGGLVVDIQPPDYETRVAILSYKAMQQKMTIPDAVLEFIAKRVQRNVRDLEGCLNKIVAYSQLSDVRITLDYAHEILWDVLSSDAIDRPDAPSIIREVCNYFSLPERQLLSQTRIRKVSLARQIAMYLLMNELEMSPTDIGRLLGGRDHATVIHGVGKISAMLSEDINLRTSVTDIKDGIFSGSVACQ